MADHAEITTEDMIACVKREIAMREKVYPGRVAAGRMTHEGAQIEIRRMQAIQRVLEDRLIGERLL